MVIPVSNPYSLLAALSHFVLLADLRSWFQVLGVSMSALVLAALDQFPRRSGGHLVLVDLLGGDGAGGGSKEGEGEQSGAGGERGAGVAGAGEEGVLQGTGGGEVGGVLSVSTPFSGAWIEAWRQRSKRGARGTSSRGRSGVLTLGGGEGGTSSGRWVSLWGQGNSTCTGEEDGRSFDL